ncbi:MAG: hypothetical protein U0931_04040 [Vulcanimicrobiota bacterium]
MMIQNKPPVFTGAPRLQAQNNNDNQKPEKEIDEHNFSWLDLGKGLVGGVVGGAIEGVGIGASSLVRSPQVAYHSLKALWKSKMLGPVLKTTLTPVVIAAGVGAPVFAALGGTLYGMFEGFKEGAEKNPLAVPAAAGKTVKIFHQDLAGKAVEAVTELSQKEPRTPEEVYEIKVIEAGKGLIGGVAGAAVAGVGVGASTLVNVPGAYVKASSEIWKSDAALPLKVGGQLLATGAAVLAVPLAAVGGALYGLGTGAYHGYSEGIGSSVVDAGKDVKKYHDAVCEAIYK